MKYIKHFNENKESYYVEYNAHFVEFADDIIDMPTGSIEYIETLFGENWKLYSDWELNSNANRGIHIKSRYRANSIRYLDIIELKDEYFLVIIVGNGTGMQRYKCDQLDGVRELLMDKGIIQV